MREKEDDDGVTGEGRSEDGAGTPSCMTPDSDETVMQRASRVDVRLTDAIVDVGVDVDVDVDVDVAVDADVDVTNRRNNDPPTSASTPPTDDRIVSIFF